MAEKKGFEPMRDLRPLAVFETAPFNHLGTSPAADYYNTRCKKRNDDGFHSNMYLIFLQNIVKMWQIKYNVTYG